MKHHIYTFLAGLLFAVGLGISGMTNADKVIGFLNLAGPWDPSLAFVMVGAIGIHMVLYRVILKRESPLFTERFQVPTRKDIDVRLVAGSALFGVGWGLGGFCPGPGLVSGPTLSAPALVFVGTMLLGMFAFETLKGIRSERGEANAESNPATNSPA